MRKKHQTLLASLLVAALCLPLGAPAFTRAGPPTPTIIARLAPAVYQRIAGQVTSAIDYGGLVWVEMTAAQAAALKQAGVPYEAQPLATRIGLYDYHFDTRVGEPAIPTHLRATESDAPSLHLVQLVGPTRGEWLEGLESTGLRVLQYVPRHAYLVWGTPQQVQVAKSAPMVRWTGAFHPAYKINPRLGDFKAGPIEHVAVTFYNDGALGQTLAALERLGARPVQHYPAQPDGAFYTAILALDAERLADVARLPAVWAIDYASPRPGLDDELADQIVAGNYPGGTPVTGYYDWLTDKGVSGYGITWADVDTGLNSDHPDVTGRAIAFVSYPGAGAANTDPDGHGSHTAGAIFGDGRGGTGITDLNGFYWGAGVAPSSNLVVQNALMGSNWPPSGGWQVLSRDSVVHGALGSSNSWYTGASGSQGYSIHARTHDIMVRDANWDTPAAAEPIIMVFSAGNEGDDCGSPPCYTSITEPKEAKNLIVVGASANYPRVGSSVNDVVYFSSRGPAQDGRLLPTVAAPGRQTVSFNGDGANCGGTVSGPGSAYYNYCSGTSMACPLVAGSAALIADWWAQEGWGTPSPALVKALLINGAVDMVGGDNGGGSPNTHLPNNDQGWGLVNLNNVIRNGATMLYRDQEHLFTESGQTWTLPGGVADPTRPFKVTLVWSDAPGAAGANPTLVNDLDLEVTVGGTTYKGNVFANGWSTPGGTTDSLNNIECVYVPSPGAASAKSRLPAQAGLGDWVSIKVTASNVAGDGVPYNGTVTDQDFSLVVYNMVQEPDFTVSASPESQEVCAPQAVTYSVPVGVIMGYSETVTLSLGNAPANTPYSFEPASATPPFTATLTLTTTAGTPDGSHALVITGTAEATKTHAAEVNLVVSHTGPPAPALISPAIGATDVPMMPTFQWSPVPGASSYRLQADTDPLFTSPILSVSDLTTTTYHATTALPGGACVFWRVNAVNVCDAGDWSDVGHFETEPLHVAFWDDMESGGDQWAHAAGAGDDAWALVTNNYHSPTHSWFSPDVDTITDDYLWITTPFAATSGAALTFWHRYNLEAGYDGGVIEVSTNGGGTWADLGPHIVQGPYDRTISASYDSPIGGRQAWSGNNSGWEKVVVDLSAYAGQDVMVRWRLACDRSVDDEGWYVDDVEVIAALPPNDFAYDSCALVNVPIHFTATASSVCTYAWDFGGPGVGADVTTATPTFTYTTPGAFVVQLTLENPCASEVITHEVAVTDCEVVHDLGFSVSPNPRSNAMVTFTASASGAAPITYGWDLGDGGTGSGIEVTHTYTAGGDYTVTLTATNCDSAQAQVAEGVFVCDSVHNVNVTATVMAHQEFRNWKVQFMATGQGTEPITYAWDFGDGSIGSGLIATHTYTAAGSYTVTLTATNCGDARVEVTRAIHVRGYKLYLPLAMRDG